MQVDIPALSMLGALYNDYALLATKDSQANASSTEPQGRALPEVRLCPAPLGICRASLLASRCSKVANENVCLSSGDALRNGACLHHCVECR